MLVTIMMKQQTPITKFLFTTKNPCKKKLEEVIREKKFHELKNSGNKNSDPVASNNNTKTGETQEEYLDGTAGIKEDSILNNTIKERLSRYDGVAKVHNFQDATVDDMKHHVIALFRKESNFILIYPDTNDAPYWTSRKTLDHFLTLKGTLMQI